MGRRLLLLLALFIANYSKTSAQSGSLDATFDVGVGFDSTITTFALQPDGKIVVGGNFTSFNGISRNRIARLNSDGSLDMSFSVGSGITGYAQPLWIGITGTLPSIQQVVCVHSIVIQPSAKIVVAGNFYRYNGVYCGGGIVRLNSDGSIDTTFRQGDASVDTNTIVATTMNPLAGVWVGFLAPFAVDTTTLNVGLQNLFQQSDGNIVANGLTAPGINTFYGNAPIAMSIFRCSGSTGSIDASFSSGNFWVPLSQQTDGKIIVAGGPQYINRMNTNGTLDGTFNLSTGSNNEVSAAVIQPDGHIILGGAFTNYDGVSRNYITRINTDRSLDMTFNVGTGFNLPVNSLAIQSDGKVIVGGEFITYNSALHNRIARLNTDGSIDASFTTGSGFDSKVNQVLLQPDGKILVSGSFTNYNGTVRNKMARLNADAGISGFESVAHSQKIFISPNPAQTVLNISSDMPVTNVSIQTPLGQIVYSNSYNDKSLNIDVQRLPSGMYFVNINNSKVYKVVKQ